MNTITQQLAEALRTIVNDKGSAAFNDDLEAYDAAVEIARNALAAYDVAQTNKGTVKSNREWREECALLRDALLQAQLQIRHLRQAHDALVSALREASRALCELDALGEHHDAALIGDALAAYDALAASGGDNASALADIQRQRADAAERRVEELRKLCGDMLKVFEAARPLRDAAYN